MMLEPRGDSADKGPAAVADEAGRRRCAGPPGVDGLDPPATAFAEPFDTYCDMSHLLAAENDGREDGPKGVAYFCAVLPDAVDPAPQTRQCATARATIWSGTWGDLARSGQGRRVRLECAVRPERPSGA